MWLAALCDKTACHPKQACASCCAEDDVRAHNTGIAEKNETALDPDGLECCDWSGLQLLALRLRHLALVAGRISRLLMAPPFLRNRSEQGLRGFVSTSSSLLSSSLIPEASTAPCSGISGSASGDALAVKAVESWKAKSLQRNKEQGTPAFVSLHTCGAGCDLHLT